MSTNFRERRGNVPYCPAVHQDLVLNYKYAQTLFSRSHCASHCDVVSDRLRRGHADNDTASQARSQFPAAQSVGSNGSFDSDKDADHSLVQASEQAGPKPTLAAKAASGGTTKNAASSMDTSSSGNLYPNGGCYRLH